jgi:hypothetical protein
MERILGKRNIRTDTKILETLVELDPGPQLPLGLRFVRAKRRRHGGEVGGEGRQVRKSER